MAAVKLCQRFGGLNNFILAALFYSVVTCQVLHINHAPNYMKFLSKAPDVHSSDIPKIITHALGLPLASEMNWDGMLEGSIFKRPKANVLITIFGYEGIQNGHLDIPSAVTYKVIEDIPYIDVNQVTNSLQENHFRSDPLIVDMEMDNDIFDVKSGHKIFQKLQMTRHKVLNQLQDGHSIMNQFDTGSLNMSSQADLTLLGELQVVMDIIEKLKHNPNQLKTKTPDLYSFIITGLREVARRHGPQSIQSRSAERLLEKFLQTVSDDFRKVYRDSVLVETFVTSPVPKDHVRKARSLMASQSRAPKTEKFDRLDLDLASDYYEDYPPIFNIILWGMIVLAFVVFIVSVGMWHMDPGRDSVIYRMTSQRLKKD